MIKGSAGIGLSNAGEKRVKENKLNSEVFMVYRQSSPDNSHSFARLDDRLVTCLLVLRLSVCFCFQPFSGL